MKIVRRKHTDRGRNHDPFFFVRGFVQTEREPLFQDALRVDEVRPAMEILGWILPGAKSRSKINQVMTEKFAAILFHVSIESIVFLHVPVIDPRCDHSESSKFAPVLVRYPIVRVVRSEEHTSELQSPYDLVCRL